MGSQIICLQVALFKAKGKTSKYLSLEPGLSYVRDALSAIEMIYATEIPRFLDGLHRLASAIFSTPTTYAEHSSARKKQCADTQAKLLVQLQSAARDKINAIKEFLKLEALVAVEELKGKVSGLELAQILQPTTQTVAPTESSSGTKKNVYKRNKNFLRARKNRVLGIGYQIPRYHHRIWWRFLTI